MAVDDDQAGSDAVSLLIAQWEGHGMGEPHSYRKLSWPNRFNMRGSHLRPVHSCVLMPKRQNSGATSEM